MHQDRWGDVAELKPIALGQAGGQFGAGSDGMIEPELDQFLADRQGDEPLHRLA
ncbi:hypothetical protein [Pelagibius sp.]|uniref:hypothetical protein n=1 Tax=Pelagibius sp. TaxID=1931238 RepID=UPI003C7CD01A